MVYGPLDFLPLPAFFLLTVVLVLASVETGYRFGRARHRRPGMEKEAPVGAMVAATLGLFGFLLAFTFGMAANRFDAKREVLINEVNAIGTSWLRADLLDEPRQSAVRRLLSEYVDLRLAGAAAPERLDAALRRSDEIHAALWTQASAAGRARPESVATGLFIQSVNEVIDMHGKRISIAVRSRIPGSIWVALAAVAVLAMSSMGYHAGLSATSRSIASVVVAVTFSAVIWLIANLDRSWEGSLTVSQQAMLDLRESMQRPASAPTSD